MYPANNMPANSYQMAGTGQPSFQYGAPVQAQYGGSYNMGQPSPNLQINNYAPQYPANSASNGWPPQGYMPAMNGNGMNGYTPTYGVQSASQGGYSQPNVINNVIVNNYYGSTASPVMPASNTPVNQASNSTLPSLSQLGMPGQAQATPAGLPSLSQLGMPGQAGVQSASQGGVQSASNQDLASQLTALMNSFMGIIARLTGNMPATAATSASNSGAQAASNGSTPSGTTPTASADKSGSTAQSGVQASSEKSKNPPKWKDEYDTLIRSSDAFKKAVQAKLSDPSYQKKMKTMIDKTISTVNDPGIYKAANDIKAAVKSQLETEIGEKIEQECKAAFAKNKSLPYNIKLTK